MLFVIDGQTLKQKNKPKEKKMARTGKKPLNLLIDGEILFKYKTLCQLFKTTMTEELTDHMNQYIKEKWPEMLRVMNAHNKYYPTSEEDK